MVSLNEQVARNVERVAKLYERKARQAILNSVKVAKERGDFATAMDEIAGGNVPYLRGKIVQRLLDTDVSMNAVAVVSRDAFVGGGKASSKLVAPYIGLAFDPTLPDAIQAARLNSARLMIGISKTTKEAIRHMVMDAFNTGIAPYELADVLRQIIGLTKRDAQAVATYRGTLLSTKIARNTANKMANDYAQRLVLFRARNIARTEMMTAVNLGQLTYWKQAQKANALPSDVRRIWIATVPSERTCPICGTAGLHNATAALGGAFPGGYMNPPAHPQCRCTTGLTSLVGKKVMTGV